LKLKTLKRKENRNQASQAIKYVAIHTKEGITTSLNQEID